MDERRRRRLASESTVTTDYTAAASPVPDEPPPVSENSADRDRFENQTDFPLARLISARKSKLITAVILLVAATSGLTVFGQSEAVRSGAYGDTVSRVFLLPNGLFFPQYCALMLIAAAQLAFSIGWVRSRNPRDFGGYYRIWRWVAAMLFVAAVCVATGLHHGIAELVAHYFPRRYPHRHVLNWLVPISVLGFPITMKMLHDMSNCRLSTALLSLTILGGITVAVVPVVSQLNVDGSTLMIGQTAVCCAFTSSLLIHTWFVLHVSSEPPGQSTGLRATEKMMVQEEFADLDDLPEFTEASTPFDADMMTEVQQNQTAIKSTTEPAIEQTNVNTGDQETDKTLRLDTPHPVGETGRRGQKSRPKSKRKSRSKRRQDLRRL